MLNGIDSVASVAPADGSEAKSANTPVAAAQDDSGVKDLLQRTRRPDQHYCSDVMISSEQKPLLLTLQRRLGRMQKTVGHGKFALLGVFFLRA